MTYCLKHFLCCCCYRKNKKTAEGGEELPDESQKEETTKVVEDLYQELNFAQLYKSYLRLTREMRRMGFLRVQGAFKTYVDKYTKVMDRNFGTLKERIMVLTEQHIERVPGAHKLFSNEEKIHAVYQYYLAGMSR